MCRERLACETIDLHVCTAEQLNKGHVGASHFVLCSRKVACPFFRGSKCIDNGLINCVPVIVWELVFESFVINQSVLMQ